MKSIPEINKTKISFYCFSKSFTSGVLSAIDNVYQYVDELVIVLNDPFKETDLALNLDIKNKVKFYQKTFTYFADMRNYALSKATGSWIVWLDSDETFSNHFLEHIQLYTDQKIYNGYKIHRMHFYQTAKQVNDPFMHLRLFKINPQLRYMGRVHELLDGVDSIKEIEDWVDAIFHFNSYEDMKLKNMQYRSILLKELDAAIKSGKSDLIELAKFRVWCNGNIDNVDMFYQKDEFRNIKNEYTSRLKRLLKEDRNYHENLLLLEKIVK